HLFLATLLSDPTPLVSDSWSSPNWKRYLLGCYPSNGWSYRCSIVYGQEPQLFERIVFLFYGWRYLSLGYSFHCLPEFQME
ncbi:hypothetical protein Dsin_008195, partial [Dipteronia sinensis]